MLGHLAVEGLSRLRVVGLPSEARQLALQELDLRKSTRHGNSAHTCRHWVPALATCFAFQHTHVPAPPAGTGHLLASSQDHVPLLPTPFRSDTSGTQPHVNEKLTTVHFRAGPAPPDGAQATVAARWRHPHRVHPPGAHVASPICASSVSSRAWWSSQVLEAHHVGRSATTVVARTPSTSKADEQSQASSVRWPLGVVTIREPSGAPSCASQPSACPVLASPLSSETSTGPRCRPSRRPWSSSTSCTPPSLPRACAAPPR